MTLDSDNIRFIWLWEFPAKEASYNSGVIENVFFQAFGRYVFGILGNEANIIVQYYLVRCDQRILPAEKCGKRSSKQ